jgi:hypothetical protein
LPFTMETNGNFSIPWRDRWSFSVPTTGTRFRLESLNKQDGKPDTAITQQSKDGEIARSARPVL